MAKVKTESVSFNELMVKVENGEIRIPDFQREFVWDRSQILNLLDSIYRQYPIGSFLFWETEDAIQSYRRVGDIELQVGDGDRSVQYVLDGQQRITSLFASLKQAVIAHRVNGRKVTKSVEIYFDLDEKVFVADPFKSESDTAPIKYKGSPPIDGVEDYAVFTKMLLSEIGKGGLSYEGAVQWISANSDAPKRKARMARGILWTMDLFDVEGDITVLTARGEDYLRDDKIVHVLLGLIEAVEGYEPLFEALKNNEETSLDRAREILSHSMGRKISPGRVRARLSWLMGFGVGRLENDRYLVSSGDQRELREALSYVQLARESKEQLEEENRKRYISVRMITDIFRFADAVAALDGERRESLTEVCKTITDYPFSIIKIKNQPIETACEIFERVNNSGQVLNVVDLMVAKSWSSTFNLREEVIEFRKELASRNFNGLPDIVLLQCAAGALTRDVGKKSILGMPRESLEDNWPHVVEAIRKSIDFLQNDLRIVHAKILPYNGLIVPLAVFYFHGGAAATNASVIETLERWFWKASISNRYDSAAETKIREDLRDMLKLIDGASPDFDYLAPALTPDRVINQNLNTWSAFCKTILCMLNYQQPLELKNGSPVSLSGLSKYNAAELHHFFPKAHLWKKDRDNYVYKDSMANIVMSKASANKEYASSAPSEYLSKIVRSKLSAHKEHASSAPSKHLSKIDKKRLDKRLKSHFIYDGDAAGIWDDNFEQFVKYRAEQIVAKLRELSGELHEIEVSAMNDSLSPVERFESRLRELINQRMVQKPDWIDDMGPEFRKALDSRISRWLRENPTRKAKDIEETNFFQLFDYYKVIKKHMPLFKDVILSKTDLQNHIDKISDYRNAIAHNRELEPSTKQLAIGALMWFENVFQAAGIS